MFAFQVLPHSGSLLHPLSCKIHSFNQLNTIPFCKCFILTSRKKRDQEKAKELKVYFLKIQESHKMVDMEVVPAYEGTVDAG